VYICCRHRLSHAEARIDRARYRYRGKSRCCAAPRAHSFHKSQNCFFALSTSFYLYTRLSTVITPAVRKRKACCDHRARACLDDRHRTHPPVSVRGLAEARTGEMELALSGSLLRTFFKSVACLAKIGASHTRLTLDTRRVGRAHTRTLPIQHTLVPFTRSWPVVRAGAEVLIEATAGTGVRLSAISPTRLSE